MKTPPAAAAAPNSKPAVRFTDLEIKDAQVIFTTIWNDLEAERGRENLRFP